MAGVAAVIELSRLVFEVLRKDEEFVLCRGRSKDDSSQAASASRLRTLRRALGSEAVEAAENRGRDVGLRRDFDELSRVAQSSSSTESGYDAPLVSDQGSVRQEPRRSVSRSRVLVLSPVVEYPSPESLKRLEHEYSLREKLDARWTARPRAIARHWDRTALVLD